MFAHLGVHHVYVSVCATDTLESAAVATAFDILSDVEQIRSGRFLFARDRRDFVVAHALLRRTLSRHFSIAPRDWEFVIGSNGKPALSGDLVAATHLRFNLAHTNGLVACAVSRIADVGVDVETIDCAKDSLQIAERCFASAEIDGLRHCTSAARPERFTEVWTLKEAYLKAIGAGFSLPLDEFAFHFDASSSLRFSAASCQTAAWSFALFAPSQRYRLAVAAQHSLSTGPLRIAASCGDPAAPGHDVALIPCIRSGSCGVG